MARIALTGAMGVLGACGSAWLWSAGSRIEASVRAQAMGRAPEMASGRSSGWDLPQPVRSLVASALHRADLNVEPRVAVQVWLAGIGIAAVLMMGIAPALAAPAGLLVAISGPVGLRMARDRSDRRASEALPGALDEVARELSGGGTVQGAITHLARRPGPLSLDLTRVVRRTELGDGLEGALVSWAHERPIAGIRTVVGALRVTGSVGGSAAGALEGLAASLRERAVTMAEARALSSQARLSAVVIGGAPIGYLVFSAMVDRRAIDVLTGTWIGRSCLTAGLALEVMSAAWMRRVVRAGA